MLYSPVESKNNRSTLKVRGEERDMNILGTILDIVVAAALAGVVLMIVSRLNMGLKVANFKAAFIAAIAIAVVAGVIAWFLGLFSVSLSGPWISAIVALIVAAVVLLTAARFVPGLEVKGFGGAIIAAIGIGIVTWIGNWFIGLFVH